MTTLEGEERGVRPPPSDVVYPGSPTRSDVAIRTLPLHEIIELLLRRSGPMSRAGQGARGLLW